MDIDTVNIRYMVDDVHEAIDFYTKHLGFELLTSAAPAFADVKRGNLRLLLSGPTSSAGRPMPDGAKPGPGGWNRVHFDHKGAPMTPIIEAQRLTKRFGDVHALDGLDLAAESGHV